MSELSPLQKALLGMKDVADQMPAVPALVVTPPADAPCEICGTRQGLHEFPVHWTGVAQVRDLLCRSCATAMLRQTCHLVCLNCKVVFTRMQPFKDRTGFVFQAGTFYHMPDCPRCQPLVEGTTQKALKVIEFENYKKAKYAGY